MVTTGCEELWLPSRSDGIPECLMGEPLLLLPGRESFFRLVTSSVWTPLTWGDSVRAVPHSQGGYVVTGLAAAGPHLRVLLTYSPSVPRMRARTTAVAWQERGLLTIEVLPGLIVTAWDANTTMDEVQSLLSASPSKEAWEIVDVWSAEQRTPEAISEALHES